MTKLIGRAAFEHQLAIMQAVNDGKAVQIRANSSGKWRDYTEEEMMRGYEYMDFTWYEWRIKPEPKVIWANEYPGGHLAAHDSAEKATHFAGSSVIRKAVKYVEAID